MGEYLIGVDVGTAGTKSGLFDTEGNLVAKAYEESKLYYPRPGWVEQDMEDFYRSAVSTIRQVIERSKVDPRQIAALAIDAQMSGIGMIDREWKPTARYDSWLDTRCEPYINYMQQQAGEEVLRKTGCPPTYAHGPKILWWKEQRPETYKRTAKFVVAGCYVAGRMAGLSADDAFIDYTHLNFTGFADTQKLEWDEELCRVFGVTRDKLPQIVNPTDIVGRLSRRAANDCGLLSGTPIAAGAGDAAASYLGAGVVEHGIIFDVAGTASILSTCAGSYSPDVEYGTIMCMRSVIEGLWNPVAFINGGGLCLRWFRDEIADLERAEAEQKGEDPYEVLNRLAAKVPPGSDGLLFIPHLGGRVLPAQPSLRGSWVGFSWGQSKGHFYRSILEAVAYEYYSYFKIMRHLYPNTEFREARVLGGGAKSGLWNQIKADVLNVPYVRVSQDEPAILASALIAGNAAGLIPSLTEVCRRKVQVRETLNPSAELNLFYREYAEAYSALLEGLRETYEELDRLRTLSPDGPNP